MADVSYNIIDRINLEDLCKSIGAFLAAHGTKTVTFYGIGYDVSTPSILTCAVLGCDKSDNEQMKKIFKGDTAPSANKRINHLISYPAEAREDIMDTCAYLERIIRKQKEAGTTLLTHLLADCNTLYFTPEEMEEINGAYRSFSEEDCFLGHLFLHALFNVSINLPKRMADRIFHEALTLHPENPMRQKLMRCAAECGHRHATLIYANEVYTEHPTYAFDLFLSLFEGDSNNFEICANALWEVGFMTENHMLDSTQKERVRKLLNIGHRLDAVIAKREKANRDDLGNCDISDPSSPPVVDSHQRDMLIGHTLTHTEIARGRAYMKNDDKDLAYMIYLYIAKRDLKFPKALNSLGKLLLGDYILDVSKVPESVIPKEQMELALHYLRLAASFGNTNAMVNIAIFYYNQHRLKQEGRPCIDISERQLQEMHRLFRVAADLDEASARYYMGELLLEQGEQAQAIRYLEFSSGSITPRACHQLGRLYAATDPDKAQQYFRDAIGGGFYNAALDLAMLYAGRYNRLGHDSGITFLQEAAYILDTYIPSMSNAQAERAHKLLASWERML